MRGTVRSSSAELWLRFVLVQQQSRSATIPIHAALDTWMKVLSCKSSHSDNQAYSELQCSIRTSQPCPVSRQSTTLIFSVGSCSFSSKVFSFLSTSWLSSESVPERAQEQVSTTISASNSSVNSSLCSSDSLFVLAACCFFNDALVNSSAGGTSTNLSLVSGDVLTSLHFVKQDRKSGTCRDIVWLVW